VGYCSDDTGSLYFNGPITLKFSVHEESYLREEDSDTDLNSDGGDWNPGNRMWVMAHGENIAGKFELKGDVYSQGTVLVRISHPTSSGMTVSALMTQWGIIGTVKEPRVRRYSWIWLWKTAWCK
jgi:hypothetical protein